MALHLYSTVIDTPDPSGLARWWADALAWQVLEDLPGEATVGRSPDTYPQLVFVQVTDPKTTKNRLHLDLNGGPTDSRDAEVDRLLALGARRVDIGQDPAATWVVLADPEGNEFCVLRSREGGL